MADPGSLQDYLQSRYGVTPPAAPQTPAGGGMVAPQPTGTGNLVTSALASGVLGAGSQIASGVEGGARMLGATGVADAAAAEAQRARATAATYQRPDLEGGSMLDPRVLGYKVLQGLPGAVPAIAGMLMAPELAPAAVAGAGEAAVAAAGSTAARYGMVGAALGAFPGAFGGNVQAHEDYTHKPISAGQAAKAALIGVPEAAVAGLPLGKAEALLGGEGSIGGVAATQAAVAAGQTALGGMMGDPNRSLADRAQDMVSNALTGGVTGALFGAGAHALSKVPVNDVGNDQLKASMDKDLGREPQQPVAGLLPPPTIPMPDETGQPTARPYANMPTADLLKEAQGMKLREDNDGLLDVAREFQARGILNDAARPALEAPWRVGPSDISNEPEAPIAQAGSVETPPAPPVEGEIMQQRLLEPPSDRGLGSQEPIPMRDETVIQQGGPPLQLGGPETNYDRPLQNMDGAELESKEIDAKRSPEAPGSWEVMHEVEQRRLESEQAEPNRPPVEAVPEKHQPLWQKLEDVRDDVKDPATIKSIDDAQTSLVAPGRGDPQKATVVLNKAKEMAETERTAAAQPDTVDAAPAETAPPAAPKSDQFAESKAAVLTAQKSLNAMKKMDAAPADAEPKSKTITNNLWQQGLADQQARLTQVANELKKTGNPENLVGLPTDHFQNDDFWTQNDKFNKKAQLALDQHADHEENVLGALRDVPSLHARVPSPLDAAPPPGDPVNAGLHDIISNGGDTRDALAHIAANGSNGFTKTVARLLLKAGVNSDLRYGSVTPGAVKNMPFLRQGEVPTAHYDVGNDVINLHTNASLERDVLHEAAHAATMKALNADGPTARLLDQMYQDVKLRSPGNDAYGLRNVHEFVAEAFSNPDFQAHLDSLSSEPTVNNGKLASMWQKFKGIVSKMLGASPGHQTMLDEVMDAGQRLMDENKTAPRTPPQTPQDADARLQPLMARINDAHEKLKDMAESTVTNAAPKVRGAWLGFRDSLGIARWYSKFVQNMTGHVSALSDRSLLQEANNKPARIAIQKLGNLADDDRKAVQEMAKGTMIGIDGRKSWAEHTHLFDDPNAADLGKEHRKLAGLWGRMSDTAKDAYNTTITANRAHVDQLTTTSLYNILKGDYASKVPLPDGWDPNQDYRFKPELHDDPAKNGEYWASTKKQLIQLAQNHLDTIDSRVAMMAEALGEKARDLKGTVSVLRSFIADDASRSAELDRTPNFPMGREGGHFAAGKLVLADDGKAPQGSIDKLQAMLNAKGFGHLTIDRNLENPSIYARVDTPSQRASLRAVFEEARGAGILEDGSLKDGPIGEIGSGVTPQWQERAMEIMRASMRNLGKDADPATQALLEQRATEMQREFLNAMPPSSINRIMARRQGIQGFSDDMMQNVRQRMNATSRAIANMATQPRIAESVVGMKKDLEALNRSTATATQKDAAHQAVAELVKREAGRTAAQPAAAVQALKELGHVMEVGANPAYAFMLLGQNLTLGLPRLGAAMGFVNTASAMGRNTTKSFALMKAIAGGSEGLKFGVRASDLRAAGVSEKDIEFLTHQDAMGTFAHGSMTSAMQSEHGDPSSTFGKSRAWASAMGLYSEMQPRLLMALAARDLFDKKNASNRAGETMHDFVHRMVEDSQLNWDPTFNARQTTKQGSFGAMSPLLNQFMGYSTRMTEMLVREVANSFGHGSAEEQAEGRRFLMGHLAVMTTLAGSLGSPMVAVLASVYDRLADWATGSDNHDITASYRNYLASTFGKETGEVLARGVPRAFGLDLSHWGDERIAPGSTALLMLTEKRKLEDAEKDWLKAEAGSAAGMVANFGFAARDISNGDYLRGIQKMVPELFRGPVEAAQLAEYGYRDKGGQKLPITATAKDIMLTAMGLDPQQEAEYSEIKKTVTGETTLAQLRSQNITQHLSQALMRGDNPDFARWVQQSMEFQKDHPGQQPPMADLQRYMQQHIKNAAYAQATGLPVTPKNLTARGMVSYGDLHGQ